MKINYTSPSLESHLSNPAVSTPPPPCQSLELLLSSTFCSISLLCVTSLSQAFLEGRQDGEEEGPLSVVSYT